MAIAEIETRAPLAPAHFDIYFLIVKPIVHAALTSLHATQNCFKDTIKKGAPARAPFSKLFEPLDEIFS